MDLNLLVEMISQAIESLNKFEATGESGEAFNKIRSVGDICIENKELHPFLKGCVDMRKQYDFKNAAFTARGLHTLNGGNGKNSHIKAELEMMKSICKEVLEKMGDSDTYLLVSKKADPASKSEKVFIVHGHDELSKVSVARFLEQVGLVPVILHEQASSSKTIIEKIEAHSDVGYAVVIYSPCDIGSKQSTSPELKPRARQNVVFEHGYFIGCLGRSNVTALVKGHDIETPNDISGVVYTSLDERGAWKLDLAKELKAAGYSVELSNIL